MSSINSNEMREVPYEKPTVARRWLPNEEAVLKHWHSIINEEIEKRPKAKRHLIIQEFEQLIDDDPVVRMYMTQMIQEIPRSYRDYHPKDLQEFLERLNAVLTVAPPYIPGPESPLKSTEAQALVGTPFSALLIWTMGTPSGFAAYRNPKINAMFKKLLNAWAGFLNSESSLYVLNDSPHGWMCEKAQNDLKIQDYQYDPEAPQWGFSSWNDFFTREVRPEARPIAGKDDDKVIVASCDSTFYKIGRDAQDQSEFWIKSQPYSLEDMLDHQYVERFVGGDVWQAFLSPFNYHRWHSPVAGKIVKAYVKEGLYFSQATDEGEDPSDQDGSEGYITHVQTRALFFIEADDKKIGMVCVMPVGMVEISSCVINENIKAGAHVEKGEELGHFQFGGSTHCVIFEPGVIKDFKVSKDDKFKFGEEIATAN